MQVPEQSLSCFTGRRWKCMWRRILSTFFEPLKASFLQAPWFPSTLRSLGGEGRTCHFKSTTAKRALANSSCVLTCLYCADGDPKKFGFTLVGFLFCNAPSCLPRCSLSMHCLRSMNKAPLQPGHTLARVKSAPHLAAGRPAQNNCALG